MLITIKDILLMKEFSRCKLISGESGINNIVKSINSMEIPDITDWLSEGELLITTGYSIKDSPKKMEDLIVNLSKMKCAGLAIKTRFIKKINNNVLTLSNTLKIPIIHIPDDISFSDLSTPIMKKIVEMDNLQNKISIDMYNRFINIGIENLGIEGISTLISNIINSDVLILDKDFRTYVDNDKNKKIIPYLKSSLNLLNEDGFTYLAEIDLDVLIKRVIVKKKIIAYIIVLNLVSKDYTNTIDIVLEQATKLLSLEILKLESVSKNIFDLDNIFLTEILENNFNSNEQIEVKAESLNWPNLPYTIILLHSKKFNNLFANKDNSEIVVFKKDIYSIINAEFYKNDPKIKITSLNNDFYIIINSNNFDKKLIEQSINNTINEVNNYCNIKPLCIIGDSIDKLDKIPNKIHDLELALSIYFLKKDKAVFIYEKDTIIEQFFLKNKDNYYLKQFIENTIGNIIDNKSKDSLDLFKTLYEYLKTGCNTLRASKNLYIHRNTLTYRLKKIEKILECDLNSFEDRYKITIAFKINEIIKYY
ncbi:PucR family transcriptional regulator [Miniphocaeibacter halophilus]|uniref:PucR family transcriptional regulator n=1 Tax=Miniphocaeibacter halophilus TaxID=2931922 RepID=A0AC61MYD9_9FIRM|nr:PucR family transcriptional regulator [Miniphocaeibacter halophilus]QQK08359.1 PucR family transcriptional regulator [Miniphocaeibacter halophilus]